VYSEYTFFRDSSYTVIKNLFLLSWFPFFHCSAFCAMSFQFDIVFCLSYYGLTLLCICLVLDCFMFLSGFGLTVCCSFEIMDQLYCFLSGYDRLFTVSVRFWIDFYISFGL